MADADQEAYEKWARAIDQREGVVRPSGYQYKMPSHMRGSVHRGRLNPFVSPGTIKKALDFVSKTRPPTREEQHQQWSKFPELAGIDSGARVRINPHYGGGFGSIIEESPGYSHQYATVKVGKDHKIFHVSDLRHTSMKPKPSAAQGG